MYNHPLNFSFMKSAIVASFLTFTTSVVYANGGSIAIQTSGPSGESFEYDVSVSYSNSALPGINQTYLTTVGSDVFIGLEFNNNSKPLSVDIDILANVPDGYALEYGCGDVPDGATYTAVNNRVTISHTYDDFYNDAETTCAFEFTKLGSVAVTKTENGVDPTLDWNFNLSGETFSIGPSTPDSPSNYLVSDLGPGTYQLCETNIPVGWQSTLGPVDATGSACQDITLGIESFVVDSLSLTVENTLVQIGEPRSKGYWKNWSSCTNGGQFAKGDATDEIDTLDEAIGNHPNAFTPYAITPDLVVDNCEQAHAVLSGELLTGENNNNDGAAALASQLLAAKMNQAAGQFSGCNAEVFTAIDEAVALLDSVNYDGTATVLGPRNKVMKEQRGQAYELQATLEMYNTLKNCALSP